MYGFKSIVAATIGVSGPNSSRGVAATIIAAPANVTNTAVTTLAQQALQRTAKCLLGSARAVDGGTIAPGTRVDSYMIFLNKPGNVGGTLSHINVVWEFSGKILGVMSARGGTLEAASTPILDFPGTTYEAPINARRMESNDSYSLFGDRFLTVNMRVTQPGDWIRVVTDESAIPVPAALPLMLVGLGGLGAMARHKKRKAA